MFSKLKEGIIAIKKLLPNAVDFGFTIGSAVWGITILTYPWDLYFEAKAVRTGAEDTNKVNQLKKLRVQELYEEREKSAKEIEEGDEAEKVKKQKRLDEIDAAIRTMNIDPYGNALYFHSASEIKHMKQLENVLLGFAISGHIISGSIAYAFAHYTGEKYIRKSLSYIFLGSVLIRPLSSLQYYMSHRIMKYRNRFQTSQRDSIQDVKSIQYSQENQISSLKNRIYDMEYRNNQMKEDLKRLQQEEVQKLNNDMKTVKEEKECYIRESKERFKEVTKNFEETVNALTKDEKIIEDVKKSIQDIIG